MTFDSSLFVDVANALGLGNPAIVEKDYYVVQLLQHISTLEFEYHQIVFSGGTALAKSATKTYRMSEDIDLKLVPRPAFSELASKMRREMHARLLNSGLKQLWGKVRYSLLRPHLQC